MRHSIHFIIFFVHFCCHRECEVWNVHRKIIQNQDNSVIVTVTEYERVDKVLYERVDKVVHEKVGEEVYEKVGEELRICL